MVIFQMIFVVVVQIIIPSFLVIWLFHWRPKTKLILIVGLFELNFSMLLGFIIFPWAITSFYLRYFFLAFLALASLFSLRKLKTIQGVVQSTSYWIKLIMSSVIVLILAVMIFSSVYGRFPPSNTISLEFPLRGDGYYVGHGGNSIILNYHQISKTQKYALDITKINRLGMRADGLFPSDLSDYAIFKDTLFSPCDGMVANAVDTLDNQDIGNMLNKLNPAGNHVIIQYDSVSVLMAHMQPKSLFVQKGSKVRTGDPIGLVGNSGNTSEPHLHIHAVQNGEGVPILFSSVFLARNDIVNRK